MGEGRTACCTAGEGSRGGRSGVERALGLHLRIFRLIGAVIRSCGRCSHLLAGMLSNRPENGNRNGRSQAFLTSLGLEWIFV